METPFFLIHESLVDKNIDSFAKGMSQAWENTRLAYSVKTNALPWVLKKMRSRGVMAEVVSDEEYELALACGFEDTQIVFNGPIKGHRMLERALTKGAFVNLDSARDIELAKEHATKNSRLGIRINVPVSSFEESDVGYCEEGFRFGFSDNQGDVQRVLHELRSVTDGAALGLHLHCNSITRSLGVYKSIARYAATIIRKHEIEVSFIDIGGGFYGGIEGKPSPYEYARAIREELKGVIDPAAVTLLVEPGSGLIGSTTDLCTSVLDVKDTDRARIVTTDGSRVHVDPLWKKEAYTFSVDSDSNNTIPVQVICGYTCMDHDRLMVLNDSTELRVGDSIVYHRVGAYSMTLGGMFIRYYPEVYVKEKTGELKIVRSRISTDEYIRINS